MATFEQQVADAVADLQRISAVVEAAIPEAVLAGAKYGADQARQRAPVRAVGSGTLRDSIRAEAGDDKNSARVVAGAFYAYFVERGTRKPVRAARPFMQPGISGQRKRIGEIISQAIAAAVERQIR